MQHVNADNGPPLVKIKIQIIQNEIHSQKYIPHKTREYELVINMSDPLPILPHPLSKMAAYFLSCLVFVCFKLVFLMVFNILSNKIVCF